MKEKNTSVELLRFIAAVGIMLYHFGAVYLGKSGVYSTYAYVFVEFFLMLTGFFMMQHLETHEEPLAPADYLIHKIKSFYWMFLIVFGAQFIFYIRTYEIRGAGAFFKAFFHFKWEILLLHCSGALKDPAFNKDYLLGQDWYLSAMVLALLFVYPAARYYRRFFKTVFAPVVCVIFYALMIQYYGTLNVGSEYLGFVSLAIIRGMAGVCLGCLAYLAVQKMKQSEAVSKWPSSVWKWLSLLEGFLWFSVLMLLGNGFYTSDADLPIYLVFFFILILLSFLNRTGIAHFLNTHGKRLLSLLGRLSLCLYLSHWTVMTAMNAIAPGMGDAAAIPIYLGATGAVSLLLYRLSGCRYRRTVTAVLFLGCMAAAFCCAL